MNELKKNETFSTHMNNKEKTMRGIASLRVVFNFAENKDYISSHSTKSLTLTAIL